MAERNQRERRVLALGDTSAELSSLVRAWRRRLKVGDIPGLALYPPRRREYVSQDDIARMIGSTSYWYGELERGQQGRYSDDFLDRVAIALRLSPAEREVLYQYAVGRVPPAPHTFSSEVSDTMKTIVDVQPFPAYLSDVAWDILYWNGPVDDWFPWLPYQPNVMRWCLTYPEARTQLYNWADEWAAPMVAQMRFVHARYPDNEALTALIAEILESVPDLRTLWDTDPAVKMHPDGDRRALYVPHRRDPVPIEIRAFAPHSDLTQRLIFLVPLSPDASPGIKIPRRAATGDAYPAGPDESDPDR